MTPQPFLIHDAADAVWFSTSFDYRRCLLCEWFAL